MLLVVTEIGNPLAARDLEVQLARFWRISLSRGPPYRHRLIAGVASLTPLAAIQAEVGHPLLVYLVGEVVERFERAAVLALGGLLFLSLVRRGLLVLCPLRSQITQRQYPLAVISRQKRKLLKPGVMKARAVVVAVWLPRIGMNGWRNDCLPTVAEDLKHQHAVDIGEVLRWHLEVGPKGERETARALLPNVRWQYLQHPQRRVIVIAIEHNEAIAAANANARARLRREYRIGTLAPPSQQLEFL